MIETSCFWLLQLHDQDLESGVITDHKSTFNMYRTINHHTGNRQGKCQNCWKGTKYPATGWLFCRNAPSMFCYKRTRRRKSENIGCFTLCSPHRILIVGLYVYRKWTLWNMDTFTLSTSRHYQSIIKNTSRLLLILCNVHRVTCTWEHTMYSCENTIGHTLVKCVRKWWIQWYNFYAEDLQNLNCSSLLCLYLDDQ